MEAFIFMIIAIIVVILIIYNVAKSSTKKNKVKETKKDYDYYYLTSTLRNLYYVHNEDDESFQYKNISDKSYVSFNFSDIGLICSWNPEDNYSLDEDQIDALCELCEGLLNDATFNVSLSAVFPDAIEYLIESSETLDYYLLSKMDEILLKTAEEAEKILIEYEE